MGGEFCEIFFGVYENSMIFFHRTINIMDYIVDILISNHLFITEKVPLNYVCFLNMMLGFCLLVYQILQEYL